MKKVITTFLFTLLFVFLAPRSTFASVSCPSSEMLCTDINYNGGCASPCVMAVTSQGGPGGRSGAVGASCKCEMPATNTAAPSEECQGDENNNNCSSTAPYCWSATGQHPICRTQTHSQALQQNQGATGAEVLCGNGKTGIYTAIGCIPVLGGQQEFATFILTWAIGIGGGIAFLLIVYAGFMIMTSSGNPERLKAGQELLTAAISGLVLLIFSVFILNFIGVKIFGIFS